ncbi:hypothetical protein AOLI_G00079690 [Acnodon oligacanthus]
MGILADYLQKWHLQLIMGKTVAAAYHLNNREASRELDVYDGKNHLEFPQAPMYLGVRLDQTLSYKQHLDEVKAEDLVHPPLGWIDLRSFPPDPSHIHASPCPTCSQILCPCLEQKSTCELVLAGITPASLRRDAVTLTLARKAQKHDWHILHKATITLAPQGRLKSRQPHNKAAQEMLQSIPEDLSRDDWLAATWKQTQETAGPSRSQQYIREPGEDLPRHLWTLLNALGSAASSHR